MKTQIPGIGVGSDLKIWARFGQGRHGSVHTKKRSVGALGQIKLIIKSLTYLGLQSSREHTGAVQ